MQLSKMNRNKNLKTSKTSKNGLFLKMVVFALFFRKMVLLLFLISKTPLKAVSIGCKSLKISEIDENSRILSLFFTLNNRNVGIF